MCCVIAGRNIHALDPYRMPNQAALERGSAVAHGIIDSHMQANGGAYPETVAVCLYPGPQPSREPYTQTLPSTSTCNLRLHEWQHHCRT